MSHHILILEENESLSTLLVSRFIQQGHQLRSVPDVPSVLQSLERDSIHLILIDDSVPAHEACGQLRYAGTPTPLIIVSADSTPQDRAQALYAGADDYITKPFDVDEVIARIHAVLRRIAPLDTRSFSEYHFGDVHVNFITGLARKNGEPLNLSAKELRLLRFLIVRQQTVVTREELLAHVWGYRAHTTRTIDVHVAAVRRKVEDDPQHPHFIVTERGKGYRFRNNACKELLT